MDSTCPSRSVLSNNNIIPFVNHVNPINVVGASLPLLFGLLGEERTGVDGFIKQISVGSSYNWYMHLTQFESIFLGIIFLQIIVLRAVGILPIQLNKFVNGDPSGRRRKRRSVSNSEDFQSTLGCDKDFLGESAFAVIRKLDDQECIQRALCVIQSKAIKGHPIPKSTKELLTALKMSAKRRAKISNLDNPTKPTVTKRTCMNFDEANGHIQENVESHYRTGSGSAIQIFEDAVMAGIEESKLEEMQRGHLDPHLSQNSTINSGGGICGRLYKGCSLSSDDIIHYFDIIAHAGMI